MNMLTQALGPGSALLGVHSLALALSHGAAVLAGEYLGYQMLQILSIY